MLLKNYNIDGMRKKKFSQFEAKVIEFFKFNFSGYDDETIEELVKDYNYANLAEEYDINTEQDIVKFLILQLRTDCLFLKDDLYSDCVQEIFNAGDVSKALDKILDDLF